MYGKFMGIPMEFYVLIKYPYVFLMENLWKYWYLEYKSFSKIHYILCLVKIYCKINIKFYNGFTVAYKAIVVAAIYSSDYSSDL